MRDLPGNASGDTREVCEHTRKLRVFSGKPGFLLVGNKRKSQNFFIIVGPCSAHIVRSIRLSFNSLAG